MKHTIKTLAGAFAVVVAAHYACAQDINQVQSKADADLSASLRELSDLRSQIAQEKIPLSKEISGLEDQVLERQREYDRLLRARDSRTLDLDQLNKQVETMSKSNEYITGLLNEYVRNLEAQMPISEYTRYEDTLNAAKFAPTNPNLDQEGKLSAQIQAVDVAITRMDELIGGYTFDGEALSNQGVLEQGTFLVLGPTVFFASDDGLVVGQAETQVNTADPIVIQLPEQFNAGLTQLIQQGSGALPADTTLGKAIKVERSSDSIAEHIEKGGSVGYVIIALGVVAVLMGLFKVFEIMSFKTASVQDVQDTLDLLAEGKAEEAEARANQVKGAVGAMLACGAAHAKEKRGVIEELMYERILKCRPNLERFLPFLALIAAAAPLLGLLGTVIGMISTFNLITIFGTGDAQSLSKGISVALVTTEFGLIVAIPALLLHGALSRFAKRKLSEMEQAAIAFLNGLSLIK